MNLIKELDKLNQVCIDKSNENDRLKRQLQN